MKITETEYDLIIKEVKEFQTKLDTMGVMSGLISFSCDIEQIGWCAAHFNLGDPMAVNGLAWDYLTSSDDDDDEMLFLDLGDGNGPDSGESWKK